MIAVLLAAFGSAAQIPQQAMSMLSPNAAQLGEFGEVPVSLFTGVPSVEIPLTEVTAGIHTLPIRLRYHGGGVRPDQHPGWTGVGWSLEAGGCISRVVRDSVDELNHIYAAAVTPIIKENGGYYYRYGLLANNDWATNGYLFNMMRDTLDYYDHEPDEFRFSFAGYNGKFFLDHKGKWVVQCDKHIIVTAIMEDNINPYNQLALFRSLHGVDFSHHKVIHPFNGFEITVEDGTKYKFGLDPKAIEYSVDFFNQNWDRLKATSWMLTEVEYTDGQQVYFDYERDGLTAQLGISNKTFVYEHTDSSPYSGEFTYYVVPEDLYMRQGQLILPTYLAQIRTEGMTVDFNRLQSNELGFNLIEASINYMKNANGTEDLFLPILYASSNWVPQFEDWGTEAVRVVDQIMEYSALRWNKLSTIDVKNNEGEILKTFGFCYNNDDSDDYDFYGGKDEHITFSKRLFLDSILTIADRKVLSRYSFEYESPEALPPYLSTMTDHWDFYNGNVSNITHYQTYAQQRQPNAQYATIGSLTKINYPTGGFTRLEYEPNTCGLVVNDDRDSLLATANTLAGGIRVRRVLSRSDSISPIVTTEYHYSRDFISSGDNVSSGILSSIPRYVFDNYRPLCLYRRDGYQQNNYVCSIFSAQPMLPGTENAVGCHIGYSEVTTVLSDGSATVFKFTNYDDGHMDEMPLYNAQDAGANHHFRYEPFTSRSMERGLLKSREEYEYSGGAYRLKRRLTTSYEPDCSPGENDIRTFMMRVRNITLETQIGPHGGATEFLVNTYVEATAYLHHTHTMRKAAEQVETYESNSTTPIIEHTTYSYHDYNKMIKSVETNLGFGSGKHRIETYDYPSATRNPEMFATHTFSPVLETHLWSIANAGDSTLVSHNRFEYLIGHYNCPSHIYSSNGKGSLELRSRYYFDSKKNPVCEVLDSINSTVFLWGCGSRYIVAKLENATVSQVEAAIGDMASFCNLYELDNTLVARLRTELPSAMITTYRYKPLVGLISATAPDGTTTYYRYDSMGRLSAVIDNDGNIVKTYQYRLATQQ